ncbi:MAG: hypothetical protein NTU44_17560 [Bacteroidetes bacterium]|nr:hypothetical protein [Bacteroidota bacterium]
MNSSDLDADNDLITSDFMNILEMGSARAVAELGVLAINREEKRFRAVLSLCFKQPYPIAMRAARVIQMFCEQYPEFIYPYLEEVVIRSLNSKVDGVVRSFLKIFAECIDLNRLNDPGFLLDYSFKQMMDPKVKPAIRVYAMTIIEKLSVNEPDILPEFIEVLEFISDDENPSVRSRLSRLLKKVRKRQ